MNYTSGPIIGQESSSLVFRPHLMFAIKLMTKARLIYTERKKCKMI